MRRLKASFGCRHQARATPRELRHNESPGCHLVLRQECVQAQRKRRQAGLPAESPSKSDPNAGWLRAAAGPPALLAFCHTRCISACSAAWRRLCLLPSCALECPKYMQSSLCPSDYALASRDLPLRLHPTHAPCSHFARGMQQVILCARPLAGLRFQRARSPSRSRKDDVDQWRAARAHWAGNTWVAGQWRGVC